MQTHKSHSVQVDGGSDTGGTRRVMLSVAAAWVLSLGFDVFLHGGLLARLYAEGGPFVLGPEEAFRRIPLGYLAFLTLTLALYWLLRRLDVRGAIAGLRVGVAAGALLWGTFALGLFSISTAPFSLLVGWWFGQTIELGLAGAVLGAAANRVRLGRIWVAVAGAVIAFIVGTIVLQSLGLAPPMKIVAVTSAVRSHEDPLSAQAAVVVLEPQPEEISWSSWTTVRLHPARGHAGPPAHPGAAEPI